ncbi:preprotein translocase subunit SecG [bacterium]|nr:preprotein translocase subunit SecG [bacterium]
MAILHIIIAIILVILILLQEQGAGLSSSIGGEFYATRRGLEKKIFYLTIAFAFLFILVGILRVILKK